jgi:hypothetical protein
VKLSQKIGKLVEFALKKQKFPKCFLQKTTKFVGGRGWAAPQKKKEKITHCPKPYITDSVHARVERSSRV